jgi:hypothetical protein
VIALLLVAGAMTCVPAVAAPRPHVRRNVAPLTKRDARIEAAIRREVGDGSFTYTYNLVNLSKAAEAEVLVYMKGRDYCGSGGCTTFVLAENNGEYRVVTAISVTRTPMIVSPHRTNGWKDLIVRVSGGGLSPEYMVLAFDGKTYPDNPTVKPASRLLRNVTGTGYLSGADKPEFDIVVSPR